MSPRPRDGLHIRPAPAARRRLPHVRRPPDGHRRRGHRPRRARVEIENVGTTAKTLPDFPALWTAMLGGPGRRVMRRYGKNPDEDDIRVRPNPQGNRPRTQDRPEARGRRRPAWSSPSTAAGSPASSRRPARVMRDEGPRAGPQGASWSATASPSSATSSGDKDTLARIVRDRSRARSVLRRTRRRRRPGRAGGRRQRRPAGDRHRAGRPGAAAAA